MANIETCLNCLNDIDEQTLYAEGDVITNHVMWSEKVSLITEMLSDSNIDVDAFFQEASSGTGITVSKGDNLIRRIYDFIRRVIRSIINKISDILTRFKIRNYEYVELPMRKEDIQKDLDTTMEIMGKLININTDALDMKDSDVPSLKSEVDSLIKTVKGLNINMDHSKDTTRYGVKPEEFMQLRDKIRAVDKTVREVQSRTDRYLKKLERSMDKTERNAVWMDVLKREQQLYAELGKSTTKLFTGFKFRNITKDKKMSAPIEKKLNELRNNLQDLKKLADKKPEVINNSYYDDIDDDLEYFDETEKPYDVYLKNHNYDPKTNTVEIDGKRVNAGAIGSKKERNRINKFLRENNYDPKTETIETDIKNKDGSYKRIKFDMDNSMATGYMTKYDDDDEDKTTDEIAFETKYLRKKPSISNQIYKHEEGHAAQGSQKNLYYSGAKHKRNFEPVSTSKEDIHKFMDDNPIKGRKHYQDFELDADLYGYQHNKHASKDMKSKTGLSNDIKKDNKKIENMNKSFDLQRKESIDEIKSAIKQYTNNKIEYANTKLEDIIKNITDLEDMITRSSKSGSISTEDLHAFNNRFNYILEDPNDRFSDNLPADPDTPVSIEDIEQKLRDQKVRFKHLQDTLNEHKKQLDAMEAGNFDDVEEFRYELKRLDEEISDDINRKLKAIERRHTEVNNRNKYLNQHADEGGSKARKLEGRQGKHKGKQ